MSKIWFCRNCGYEVSSRGRCHRCRARLAESPLPELPRGDEEDEVGYRIAEWTDDDRGALIVALIEANVVHRFEDDDLVVGAADEERTDAVLAEVAEHTAADEDDDRDPGPPTVDPGLESDLVALHSAALRLVGEPTDMEADADASTAAAAVYVHEDHPGADEETWAAIGRVTRRLTAALGADDALEAEIARQAAILAKLLEPLVPGAAGSDAAGVAASGEASEADDDPSLTSSSPSSPSSSTSSESESSSPPEPSVSFEQVDADDAGEPDRSTSVYELPDWKPEQRAELSVLLDGAGVSHEWEGGDLVIALTDEDVTEALFDEVEGVDTGEDDEARYRVIEALFAAANRLAHDPAHRSRRTELVRAAADLDGPAPLGVDEARWLAIRNRARSLAELVEEDGGADAVRDAAEILRDDLRALV